jgi:hypothetical protein
MIRVSKFDDVYLKVDTDPSTSQELSDYLTFTVPGAQFMPQVRNRFWDGKIRLFNQMKKQLYFGLGPKIEDFCRSRNYELIVKDDPSFFQQEFSLNEVDDLAKNIGLTLEPRDYQKKAIAHAIRNNSLVAPFASCLFIASLAMICAALVPAFMPPLANSLPTPRLTKFTGSARKVRT